MDIASLLLGIGALFPACVQTYKTLASMQSFSREASALNWKLRTQELRFTTWGQAYGFKDVGLEGGQTQLTPTATNANHSLKVLQLTHGVLLAMKETFSDVDKLNTRYGLQALGSATNPLSKGSQIPLLRFRWATQDKHAFERLILDLKDFNDGLHATLVPMVQRNVDFTVCSEVSIAAHHVNDLHTIQEISQDSEMLQTTASFKAFGIELHRNEQHGITPPPPLEIPGSALRFIENSESATSDERSEASCRLEQSEFSQSVLVEWKYYEQSVQVRVSLNLSLLRIQRLVQLLGQKPKPKDFRTLDCIGYVHDRIHSRVGLVFNVVPQVPTSRPQHHHPETSCAWISLYDHIEQRKKMPILGHRIELSLALLKSMIQLHSTGWMHKGFQSSNILFFSPTTAQIGQAHPPSLPTREASSMPVDIRDPRVVGFEFSRPNSNAELSDDMKRSLTRHEVYMHPGYLKSVLAKVDMEISDANRFRPEYDMYSLGCVLLEIGLWRRLTDLWMPEYTRREETYWVQRLSQKYVPELGGRCGETYQQVVADLLSYGDMSSQRSKAPMTNFELLQALGGIHT